MGSLRPAVFVLLANPVSWRSDPRVLGVWHAASGRWALPGGKVEEGEGIAAAARRELLEETGLELAAGLWPVVRSQGSPDPDWEGREPRTLIVFQAFAEQAELDRVAGTTGPEGTAVAWVTLRELVSFFGAAFVDELERRIAG